MHNILLDENIPYSFLAYFQQHGYDVYHISDLAAGKSDKKVIELAVQMHALLITQDADFGELIYFHAYGPIPEKILYIKTYPYTVTAKILQNILHSIKSPKEGYFTISTTMIKFRPFPL